MVRTARLHKPFVVPPTPHGVGVSPWPAKGGGVLSNLLYSWYGPAGAYTSARNNQSAWPGYFQTLFGTGANRVVAFGWKKEPKGEIPQGRTRLVVATPKAMLGAGTQYRNPNTFWVLVSQDGEALALDVRHGVLAMAPARLFAEGDAGARMWAAAFAWGKAQADRKAAQGNVYSRTWPEGWWDTLWAPAGARALAPLLDVARALAAQGTPGRTDRWEPQHLGHWMGGDAPWTIDTDLVAPCTEALARVATLLPERFSQAVIELRAGRLDPDGTGSMPTLRIVLPKEVFTHGELDTLLATWIDPSVAHRLVRGSGALCMSHSVATLPLDVVKPHRVGPMLTSFCAPKRMASAHERMARAALARNDALRVLGRLPDATGFMLQPFG
jgi:hypothetical protein